jgi:hypothetical protein
VRRLLFAALVVLGACERHPVAPGPREAPTDITLEHVTLRTFRKGELHLLATSPHVEVVRTTNALLALDAGITMPANDVHLEAPRLTGDVSTGVLHGAGGVTFTLRGELRGETPTGTFDPHLGEEGGATGDAGIVLRHPRFTTTGTEYTVDFHSGVATVEHPHTELLTDPLPATKKSLPRKKP